MADIMNKQLLAINVTGNWRLFYRGEPTIPNNLQLKFEDVSQNLERTQRKVRSIIYGVLLKRRANRLSVSAGR